MKNFLRSVRSTWPYRVRLIVSIVCAALAALFWSLNFLAIHPALKILGGEKSLVASVDVDIDRVEKEIPYHQSKLDNLRAELAKVQTWPDGEVRDTQERKLTGAIAQVQGKLNRDNLTIYRLQLMKSFYARFLPGDRYRALAWLLIAVVLTVAIKGVFEFVQESLVGSVANLTLYDLRNRFYRNVMRQDVGHFSDNNTPELMARFTNDTEQLGVGLKALYGKVVAEPMKALGCVILACMISWQLTLLFLSLAPLALFILTKVGKTLKRASRRALEQMSDIYRILHESFRGIRVVKAYTMEPYERRRFREATMSFYRKAMKVVNLDALAGPIVEVLGVATVMAVLLLGAYLVLNQTTHIWTMRMTDYPLDNETLLMFYGLLAAIADPVRKLASVYTKFQAGGAAADRIFAQMDLKPTVQGNIRGGRLPRHTQSISFRNVCFSYDPVKPILSNVDLECKFGEVIALVGRNGCGKTTLLGLLPRFYDPDHGSIAIDGVDIRGVNLRSVRQQMGIVTQDTILFDDTIFNNIAYGMRRAKPEQVEAAARKAFAHEVIEKLPHGYQTQIGEAGNKLSGGEKQRIALARAILRDPSILILDEFTSQIDADSEQKIHLALHEFMRDRTTFVITHRLNTLEIADRIVVLDAGRIVAVGSHAELMKCSPVYQRLQEAHFQRRVA